MEQLFVESEVISMISAERKKERKDKQKVYEGKIRRTEDRKRSDQDEER